MIVRIIVSRGRVESTSTNYVFSSLLSWGKLLKREKKLRNKARKLHGHHEEKADEIRFLNGFIVSKETVVLRRWGRSKQKFGFIKRVDKG